MSESTPLFAFLGNMGTGELLVIALIALLLFGNRLPDVAKSIGKSVVHFKRGLRDAEDEIRRAGEQEAPPAQTKASPSQENKLPAESGSAENRNQ